MSKTTMPAIIAALVAVSMPVAFAQTTTAPSSGASSAAVTASTTPQMKPEAVRASKFIGSTVYDVQNQNVGSVKDLIFDRTGRIDAAIIDVGAFLGMGGKYVAVKLSDIKTTNDRLTLDMSKDQLKSAGEFKFPETSSTGTSTAPAKDPANRPASPPASR